MSLFFSVVSYTSLLSFLFELQMSEHITCMDTANYQEYVGEVGQECGNTLEL